MSKFSAVLVLLVVLCSSVPVSLAEDLPRHRDPLDFGPEQPNLASLEELYGFIFNFTLAGDFEGALRWLDLADLVFAPEATLAVMDRFTTLFRSEVQDLNLTRADIEVVKGLVRRLKWGEAKDVVAGALARLDGANVTVGEMDVAALGLAALLKGSPEAILAGDEELRGLIEAYREELLALLEQVEASENPDLPNVEFIQTNLVINVDPSESWVGSSVLVSGNLTDSDGVGLESQDVNVFIDNDLVVNVVTDGAGSFSSTVSLPYVYKDHVTFSAMFLGRVEAERVYLPCPSNDVEVKLLYETPMISVGLPRIVYPGKVLDVSGNVTVGGVGVEGLSLSVSVFDSSVQVVSGGSGVFSAVVPVPGDYPEGLAGVSVHSSPREVIGPSSFAGVVNVVRIPLTLNVESSSWAMSGLPFRVSGAVLLDSVPVSNCTVRLGSSVGESVVKTSTDGSFESVIGLPLSLFTADYSFNVKAYALEPWVSDSSVSGKVFVINVVSLIAVPLIVGGVVYYGSKRLRRPRRKVAVPPPVEDGLVPLPVAVSEVEGGPVGVREAYDSALELVVKRTGMSPKPSMTLREYLGATKGKLGEAERVFRSFTLMFERWLYGGSEVRVGVVERLLRRIRTLFS